jgi:hypothetical protein
MKRYERVVRLPGTETREVSCHWCCTTFQGAPENWLAAHMRACAPLQQAMGTTGPTRRANV